MVAHNWKPLLLTMVFVRTVSKIKHHDVVSFGTFGDEFPDERPCERTKQALFTLQKATEVNMVEVTAEFHC
jgi:hypothetical protein